MAGSIASLEIRWAEKYKVEQLVVADAYAHTQWAARRVSTTTILESYRWARIYKFLRQKIVCGACDKYEVCLWGKYKNGEDPSKHWQKIPCSSNPHNFISWTESPVWNMLHFVWKSLYSLFIGDSTVKGVRLIDFFNFASNLHNICFKIDYSPHLNNFPHCRLRQCLTKKLRHRVLGARAWSSGRDIINEVEEIRAITYRKQSIFWCCGKKYHMYPNYPIKINQPKYLWL